MGKVSDYAFINGKLRARIGLMKYSSYVDEMIKAPSMVELIGVLRNTRHKGLADAYDMTGDLQMVELALLEEEIDTHHEIAAYLKGRKGEFVDVVLEKVELDNLKNALRLWFSNVVREHQISYRSGYLYKKRIVHEINYDRIINASDYKGVLDAVSETPYIDVMKSFSFDDIAEHGLFDLEIALDHKWFKRVFASMSHLSTEDRLVANRIYMVDCDLKNILLFIRYYYYYVNVSIAELRNVLIPFGYVYSEMKDKGVLDKPNPLEAVRSIVKRKYPTLLESLADVRKNDDELTSRDENARHIIQMEDYLNITRRKEFSRILTGNPFTIGVVLAYLFIYKNENALIRAILSAKYYGWNEKRIREELV